ncbi:MAG: sialate O-acetylesterase [Chthoniobacteraceae bacterium]
MKTLSISRALALGLVSSLLAAPGHANVKLPAVISDNMVLLQDSLANVWGTADAGEKVTVKFAGKVAESVAGADGKWNVKLDGLTAGTIGDVTITGRDALTVRNVAVGEVWVASGQSNMEMTLSRVKDAPAEIKAANYPLLRMFTVQKAAKAEPQSDCVGKWEICTPENAPHFSAVGYFFARRLQETLKQPIGIIHTSWGGTAAELWTPRAALEADPDLKPIVTSWENAVANYPKAMEKYEKDLAAWREEEKKAKDAGTKPSPAPRPPRGGSPVGSPSSLFNGMIAPLLPCTIRGAIWYQGEANAGNATLYQKLFPTMIRSWRRAWIGRASDEPGREGNFPFLYVQLANFMARHDEPTDSNWAALREAQAMTRSLPHTGMAVTIDIGEAADIHPKDKQDVGLRLALNAEATVYLHDEEYSGPIFGAMHLENGRARLTFGHATGMKAADGGKIKGFAIAGEDRKFVWADAEIPGGAMGDHIFVSSPEVKHPVAVRYAWADNPECNLVNAAGLPASPFRTDDWPQNAGGAKRPAPAPAPGK